MKLDNVLNIINQIEKSKFINVVDKVCSEAAQNDSSLADKINNISGQFKEASSSEISHLFELSLNHFEMQAKEQLSSLGAQGILLSNILSRDGNSVIRISWLETLYLKELEAVEEQAQELKALLENVVEDDTQFDRSKRLEIYHACFKEAYQNDLRVNREEKITDDERGILNLLAKKLDIAFEEQAALEHLVAPIPNSNIQNAILALKDIGLIFISKKKQTVYVPDEIVALLNKLQGKEIADKHLMRVLRTLQDPELSNILKVHGRKIRGVSRSEKIKTIINMGLSATQVLKNDLYSEEWTVNDKKERLKTLIFDLDLGLEKLGSTLDDRTHLIIQALNSASDTEFGYLSASSFKEMYEQLALNFPKLPDILRSEFELENNEQIDTDMLRALSITPHDILYVLSNDEVKQVTENMELKKRGNLRLNILESFANKTDKYIENYAYLASRDLSALRENGIDISESEIGIKFEEVTKAIFEQLGLDVDEDLRHSINTNKDKSDIIISLGGEDLIIGEAKTCKSGDFAKYSTTSRQVKAYVNRCEGAGKRVSQVIIIAPTFSSDFIESAEMDTEVNISLIEAAGLKHILDAYKARRNPKFSAKLLTKGGLLKTDLIAKNI